MIQNKVLRKIYQLKNIVRYNSRERVKDESVAEHSFFVSLLTLMICDKLKLNESLTLECVSKAILHDMPETELNDITYDVKEKLNLRPLLKEYENEYFNLHFKNFSELMTNEETNISDVVVKIADTLSVKQYCSNEINLGNKNKEIVDIYENADKIIEKMTIRLSELLGIEIEKGDLK